VRFVPKQRSRYDFFTYMELHGFASFPIFGSIQGKDPGLVLERKKIDKKRKGKPDDGMSASLRKMLQLKAVAEGKAHPDSRGRRAPQQAKGDNATPGFGGNPFEQPEAATHEGQPAEAAPAADDSQEQQRAAKKQQRLEAKYAAPQAPAKPTLKSRKKEFLKKKKLRKKGKAVGGGDDSEEDSDPEVRLQHAAAATRPKFGETSSQPIQANLKRRHWTEEEKRVTDTRLTTLFKKQLETAKKQAVTAGKKASEATRLEAIEAYRKKKKGAGASAASLKSLAALVEKEHVASM
jgi:hypothetical protein